MRGPRPEPRAVGASPPEPQPLALTRLRVDGKSFRPPRFAHLRLRRYPPALYRRRGDSIPRPLEGHPDRRRGHGALQHPGSASGPRGTVSVERKPGTRSKPRERPPLHRPARGVHRRPHPDPKDGGPTDTDRAPPRRDQRQKPAGTVRRIESIDVSERARLRRLGILRCVEGGEKPLLRGDKVRLHHARPWVLGDGPWDAPPGVGFGRQIAKGDRLSHVLSHSDHGSFGSCPGSRAWGVRSPCPLSFVLRLGLGSGLRPHPPPLRPLLPPHSHSHSHPSPAPLHPHEYEYDHRSPPPARRPPSAEPSRELVK